MTTELLDHDIVAHIRVLQRGERATFDYFRIYSKCWRAIQHYIATSKECWLIGRPYKIMSYSECGPAIHFKSARAWSTQYNGNTPYEVDYYTVEFEIEYIEDHEQFTKNYSLNVPIDLEVNFTKIEYIEDHEQFTKNYSLNVPIDLEVNFTKEKFDKWIESIEQKNKSLVENKEKQELAKLLQKYPQGVS